MRPPIDGAIRVTQLFGGGAPGEAYQSGSHTVIGHTGIDIGCPIGTPIFPCWDGTVHVEDWGTVGFGLNVVITDAKGRKARYGHLSRVDVQEGAHVKIHVPFGATGSSGNSTGPHLHFECIEAGVPDLDNGYLSCRDPLGGFDHDTLDRFDLSGV